MYIPIWLLIIIIILIFIILQNKQKAHKTTSNLEDEYADSFSTRALKHLQHEDDVNLFDKGKFERLLKKHQKNIDTLNNDVDKITDERKKLEKALLLCQRCWQFIEDIKYYPSWFKNAKNDDGTPYWKSKAIKPDELILSKFSSSSLKKLINDSEKFSSDDEIIEYCFKLESQ